VRSGASTIEALPKYSVTTTSQLANELLVVLEICEARQQAHRSPSSPNLFGWDY